MIGIRDPRRQAGEPLSGVELVEREIRYRPYGVERREVRIARAEIGGAIEMSSASRALPPTMRVKPSAKYPWAKLGLIRMASSRKAMDSSYSCLKQERDRPRKGSYNPDCPAPPPFGRVAMLHPVRQVAHSGRAERGSAVT